MAPTPRRRRGVIAAAAVAVGFLLAFVVTVVTVVTVVMRDGDGDDRARPDTTQPDEQVVDQELRPGRYIAAEVQGHGCEWARLADLAGTTAIAAETNVGGQAIVDILDTDAALRSTGCGAWSPYTPPGAPPKVTIEDGDWVVGEQIEPGAYRVAQTPDCSWTRASGFEHTSGEVIETEDSSISLEGPFFVPLAAGERFSTQGCDRWVKAG